MKTKYVLLLFFLTLNIKNVWFYFYTSQNNDFNTNDIAYGTDSFVVNNSNESYRPSINSNESM